MIKTAKAVCDKEKREAEAFKRLSNGVLLSGNLMHKNKLERRAFHPADHKNFLFRQGIYLAITFAP
jgi:hypothetical protein